MSQDDIEGGGVYWDNVVNTDLIFFPLCAVMIAVSGFWGFFARQPHYSLGLVGYTAVISVPLWRFGGRYALVGAYHFAVVLVLAFSDLTGDPLHTARASYRPMVDVCAGVVSFALIGAFCYLAYEYRRDRHKHREVAQHSDGRELPFHWSMAMFWTPLLWFIGAHYVMNWV